VPALVLRRVTERPEAVNAGLAKVVGTDRDTIVKACRRLLDDPELYNRMARADNPFGDGLAGKRIALALKHFLENKKPLLADIGAFDYPG
jgi:UDP-N-acetylglucosamine 2-epimerase (non-hydrolysing)